MVKMLRFIAPSLWLTMNNYRIKIDWKEKIGYNKDL